MRIFNLHIWKNVVYTNQKTFIRGLLKIFLLLIIFSTIFPFVVQSASAEEDYSDYEPLWSRSGEGGIVISSDWSYIATSTMERAYRAYLFDKSGNLQTWDYPESKITEKFKDGIYWGTITADGSYVVSYSGMGNTGLFDRQGNLLWSYNIEGGVQSTAITPDGNYIVVAGITKIYLFDREGNLLWKIGDNLTSVVITPDGNYIAGDFRSNVLLFDRQGNLLWSYDIKSGVQPTMNKVQSIAITPDGSYIGVIGKDYRVYLLNKQGNLLWSYKLKYGCYTISISSDGNYVAVGEWSEESGVFYIFDNQGQLLERYDTGTIDIVKVAIAPDRSVVAITRSGKVYFFDGQGNLQWNYTRSRPLLFSTGSPDLSSISLFCHEYDYMANVLDMKGNLLWSHEFEGPGITGITFDGEQFIIDAVSKRYFFDRYGNLLRCETKDWERPVLTSEGNYYYSLNNESLMLFDKHHKLLWSYDLPTDTRYAGKSVRVSPEGTVAIGILYPSTGGRSGGYSGGTASTFRRPGENFVAWTFRIAGQPTGGGGVTFWRALFLDKQGNLFWDSGKKERAGWYHYNPWSISPNYFIISRVDGLSLFDKHGRVMWEKKNISGSVAISPDESYIVVSGHKGKLYLIDIKGELLQDYDIGLGAPRFMHIRDLFVLQYYKSDITTLYILDRQNIRCFKITGDEYYSNPSYIVGISPDTDYIIGYADLRGACKFRGLPQQKIFFYGKLEYAAREKIDMVKSMVSKASSEGFNISDVEVQYILSQADKAFLTGNYSDAIRLADAGGKKVEYNYVRGVEAKKKINTTKEAIEITRSQNLGVSNEESLLHQAEQAFSDGRYYEAIRLADQAYSIAFDMDQDGLPNTEDFLPAIPNNYIYAGFGVGLVILITTIYGVRKIKAKRK